MRFLRHLHLTLPEELIDGVQHLLAFIAHADKLRRVKISWTPNAGAGKDILLYKELTRAFQVVVKLLYQIWRLAGAQTHGCNVVICGCPLILRLLV